MLSKTIGIVCICVCALSCIWLFAIEPRIESMSPALAGSFFTTMSPWEAQGLWWWAIKTWLVVLWEQQVSFPLLVSQRVSGKNCPPGVRKKLKNRLQKRPLQRNLNLIGSNCGVICAPKALLKIIDQQEISEA